MTVRKVLVVEDDRAIRDMIVATLAESGYAVAAARNGAEGLERCRGFLPDVIVLDLHMPEVNGVEFLKQRGTTGCDAPVVLMSAAVHRVALPPELAVEAVIEKPFAIETFLDTVAAYAPDGDPGSRRRRMSRN
ncbi:MAG: response regulator [Gemmatimonadota bacterium]|nr:response regulator [Gemmatimonadota bacterium]